jgi:hypothetical protein
MKNDRLSSFGLVIIRETRRRSRIFFDEMENGVIWGHFRVSYNIESSTILILKTYVRSTMKNDRLSSFGLMHILTEILKWTCTKQWRSVNLSTARGSSCCACKQFSDVRRRDSSS